jgi:hypothetical protein
MPFDYCGPYQLDFAEEVVAVLFSVNRERRVGDLGVHIAVPEAYIKLRPPNRPSRGMTFMLPSLLFHHYIARRRAAAFALILSSYSRTFSHI